MDKVTIDGVDFVRIAPNGKRCIVVVDRGWIFAGDVDESKPGRIYLRRAVHVFKWESVGFPAVVADPKKAKADLRKIDDVDIPSDAEIFRIPVGDSWGL